MAKTSKKRKGDVQKKKKIKIKFEIGLIKNFAKLAGQNYTF